MLFVRIIQTHFIKCKYHVIAACLVLFICLFSIVLFKFTLFQSSYLKEMKLRSTYKHVAILDVGDSITINESKAMAQKSSAS